MSTTIDNRAVQLGFENRQFESGVKASLDSLSALKKGLDLTGSARSLDNLAAAGRRFSIGGIADGVRGISERFTTLGVIGMTVIQTLTTAAIDLGRKMWTSITGPATIGFGEYETQMNAIQTILANTASKGTTLDQVNDALNLMNQYADKTIYSFPEMAKNMGTFTAAGIDLQTAAEAIKGIANLAAVSGSNSQQAATAMYQLSQALSSGTVKLMDWNSVVNAGMGGQVFQDALKETARVHGIAIDDIIKKEGSFRESLSSGWLSSAILTETLSKFTGDLTKEQIISMGYTTQQADEILKLGVTANDAATKVKTLSQLRETLAEATQSGWAETWGIVVGDFGEAKILFTEISDILGGNIAKSATARNAMLQQWKDWGGRIMLIDAIRNAFEAWQLALAPIKDALNEIFPPKKNGGGMALTLWIMTKALLDFTKSLKMGGETADRVKRIFMGIFSVVKIFGMSISWLLSVFKSLFKGMGEGANDKSVLEFFARIGDFLVLIGEAVKAGDLFGTVSDMISNTIAKLGIGITNFFSMFGIDLGLLGNSISSTVTKVKTEITKFTSKFGVDFGSLGKSAKTFKETVKKAFSFDMPGLEGLKEFFDKIQSRFAPLGFLVKILALIVLGFVKLVQLAAPLVGKVIPVIKDVFGHLFQAISDAFTNLDFSKPFDIINAGLLGGLLVTFRKFVGSGSGMMDKVGGMFGGVTQVLDQVRGCLESYQKNIQAKTLMTIATAIAVLVASIVVLTLIDSKKLTVALLAITSLFADLAISMKVMSQGTSLAGGIGLAAPMLAMGVALLLLAGALAILSSMDPDELKNGLLAVSALTVAMGVFVKIISSVKSNFIGGAAGILLFGFAMDVMAGAIKKLGTMDESVLKKGLASLGALFAEVAAFSLLTKDSKTVISSAIAIGILAVSMLIFGKAIESIGSLDAEVLAKGLGTITATMVVLAGFIKLTKDGKGVISTAIGMTILAAAMLIFGYALKNMGEMSWEELGKGLAGLAGSLLIVAAAMRLMPKNMALQAFSLVLISGAIVLLSKALGSMGTMSIGKIAKSLGVLAASLLIIKLAMMGMETALPGAAAVLVVALGLAVLAPVLKSLGEMSLNDIATALLALGATFLVLGVAGLILAPLTPVLFALGVALGLIGVGIAGFGLGVMSFAAGMGMLAVTGAAGATALTAVLTSLLSMLGPMATALAGALVQFVTAIAAASPQICAAFTTLVLALLQAVIDIAPKLAEAVSALLDAIFKVIIDCIPRAVDVVFNLVLAILLFLKSIVPVIVQAGFDMLLSFLAGIADNLPKVVEGVGKIITSFLDAIGKEVPKIVDAGYKMLISLITGITKAINENQGPLNDAIQGLAEAIITGLTDGILGSVQDVINAVVNLGSGIIDALKTLLGIASPSKVTHKMGKQLDQGLTNGIEGGEKGVLSAVQSMGDAALSGFASAMSSINDAMNMSMDSYPSITPIMDLTDVLAGSKMIDSMFGETNLSMFGSLSRLSNVAGNMMGANPEGTIGGTTTSVTFNQNNYSPKSLSASEIYRQTRNQLLMEKGIVGAT